MMKIFFLAFFSFISSFAHATNAACTIDTISHYFPSSEAYLTRLNSGVRVVVLGQGTQPGTKKIIFGDVNGNLREDSIPEKMILNPKDSSKANASSFIIEAQLALRLAESIDTGLAPDFSALVLSLKMKLNELTSKKLLTNESIVKMRKHLEKLFDTHGLPPSEVLDRYSSAMFQELNPLQESGKTLKDETLFVPLTQKWFESDPSLSKFFQSTWLNSHEDIRIINGSSGEGVGYSPAQTAENNHGFNVMTHLFDLTNLEIRNASKKVRESSEAAWLAKTASNGYEKYRRMIFFSPSTWLEEMNSQKWAEYIPVDQSIGGLPDDYLFSVMIHETNVNSFRFLPGDTHSPEETSRKLWSCLQQNGIAGTPMDAETVKIALGLNPYLSVIYLSVALHALEN